MAIKIDDHCLGEETKLSQKFMGKPVYAKLIDFGALPPANSEKAVPHGISNMDQFGIDNSRSFVDQGNGNRHALFYPNTAANAFWRAKVNENEVAIQVGQGREGFSAVICVWYTKSYEIENPGEDFSDYPGELNFTLLGGSGNQTGRGVTKIGDKVLLAGVSGSYSYLAEYDSDLQLARRQVYSTPVMSNFLPFGDGYLAYGRRVMMKVNDQLTYLSNLTMRAGNNGDLHQMYIVPDGFQGPSAFLAIGRYDYKSLIISLDPSGNVLKCVQNSSNGAGFHRAVLSEDQCLFAGYCTYSSKSSGLISLFNSNIEELEHIVVRTEGTDNFSGFAKRNGGYVLGGYSNGTGTGKDNIVIVLLDESFNIEKKVYVNGTGAETLTDLQVDQAGNIVIVGTTTSVTAGGTDGLFMVFDPDLNIKTQHTFGGTGADSYESVYVNNVGNYLIAGTTSSSAHTGQNAFVLHQIGNVADLHGSLGKYPSLRINANPGFATSDQFTLTVHRNVVLPHTIKNLTINNLAITMKDSDLVQDPSAVTITSLGLDA